MNVYVLTRTSNRPKMFTRLRESIANQKFDGQILHFVYSDDPKDSYVNGDVVIHGERLIKNKVNTAPWEVYNLELMKAVKFHGIPGIVTFIDDDDMYTSEHSIATMVANTQEDSMTIWKVERENGRISPFKWQADLESDEGRICWEAAAFHTKHLPLAQSIGVDKADGGDGRFWAAMSKQLNITWLNEVLTKPQIGKGHGRRKDE